MLQRARLCSWRSRRNSPRHGVSEITRDRPRSPVITRHQTRSPEIAHTAARAPPRVFRECVCPVVRVRTRVPLTDGLTTTTDPAGEVRSPTHTTSCRRRFSAVYLGCISAVARLWLGCISAVARLWLGCISAVARLFGSAYPGLPLGYNLRRISAASHRRLAACLSPPSRRPAFGPLRARTTTTRATQPREA